jgi:uncharacterized protein (TIGR04255 family)
MTTVTNSPLAEIIAEFRWGPGLPHAQPAFVFGSSDVLFAQLAGELGKAGYSQLERTQPEGFPVQGGTIAFRYRPVAEDVNSLFQLGPGVFTANGLPPYSSWSDFRPIIEIGLKALFKLKPFPDAQEKAFLILRYIDAFTNEQLGEMSPSTFIEEVVGIRFQSTKTSQTFGNAITAHFLSTQKSSDGSEFSVEVTPGKLKGVVAVVVNTVAVSSAFNPGSAEETLTMFEPLHDL